jgi:hypothetical protein
MASSNAQRVEREWKPLTEEELAIDTERYLKMAVTPWDVAGYEYGLKQLAHTCAVLAHRLTKYEGEEEENDPMAAKGY